MIKRLLHGKEVFIYRGRYFAVPRLENLAGKIAIASHECLRGGSWQHVLSQPLGSRVLVNQKRADARRDAAWRRKVIKARFT
jgi:hypothetical protein